MVQPIIVVLQRCTHQNAASCTGILASIIRLQSSCIAVFPILSDPDKRILQSAQLLIGREVISGRMDGCRASLLYSCSCQDGQKLGRLQYHLHPSTGLLLRHAGGLDGAPPHLTGPRGTSHSAMLVDAAPGCRLGARRRWRTRRNTDAIVRL